MFEFHIDLFIKNFFSFYFQTGKEIWKEILKEIGMFKQKEFVVYEDQLNFVFDSVLAFALTLEKVLKKDPTYITTRTHTFNKTKMDLFKDEFEKLEFIGASVYKKNFQLFLWAKRKCADVHRIKNLV